VTEPPVEIPTPVDTDPTTTTTTTAPPTTTTTTTP
jgi:hypothetical protein